MKQYQNCTVPGDQPLGIKSSRCLTKHLIYLTVPNHFNQMTKRRDVFNNILNDDNQSGAPNSTLKQRKTPGHVCKC